MSEIFMYWYKMEGKKQNFGDVLGPYLVNKLSGLNPVHVPLQQTKIRMFCAYFYRLIRGKDKLNNFFPLLRSLGNKNTLISIGSIIEWYDNPNYNIWGSGLMDRKGNIHKANFYAVRGKYTQKRISDLGFKAPEALGDPGLLLPIVYNPEVKKQFKLGIIPHYNHYNETLKLVKNENILVINLLDDIEKVVTDIKSCEYTISSSLHGIIESHAYGIPSLWYNLPGDKLHGDNVKFMDYFSSIGITEYQAYTAIDINDNVTLIENIDKNCSIIHINEAIKHLQKKLLLAAPFKIKSQFIS